MRASTAGQKRLLPDAMHRAPWRDELRKKIFGAIFDQRPLKSQKHLVGKCELQPTKRRALLSSLAVQKFRLLQRVNDLKIIAPDGEILELSAVQRGQLIEQLEKEGDLTRA